MTPNLSECFPLSNIRSAQIGEMRVITANWGDYMSQDKFIRRRREQGLLVQEGNKDDEEMVRKSGFDGGWHFPEDIDVRLPAVQDLHAQYGAELVERAVGLRNWNHLDMLSFASISSKSDMPSRIAEILKSHGIIVERTSFYSLACAGVTAAFCDGAREMTDTSQEVYVGMESLTGAIIDQRNTTLTWTFGNGAGVIAAGGKDVKHIYGVREVAIDTKMTRFPRINELPAKNEQIPRESWPSHYHFINGADKAFAFTKDGGAFMEMPTDDSEKAYMDPFGVYKYFGGVLPSFLVTRLEELYETGFDFNNLGTVWSHQPSGPVIRGICHNTESALGRLKRDKGIELPMPDISWLMEGTKANNMSAATPVFHLAELVRRGLLKKGQITPVLGFGIGGVIHFDLMKFRF